MGIPTKPFIASYKDMLPHVGSKRVRVYRNLHRDCWSVKQGIVKFHTNAIFLRDVRFIVNEKVRQRVVLNKRKEVHAYVEGILETNVPATNGQLKIDIEGCISYNPYETDAFLLNGERIDFCDQCILVHLGKDFLVYKVRV